MQPVAAAGNMETPLLARQPALRIVITERLQLTLATGGFPV